MEFRYHPIVEGLKINEDGSIILYNGKELKQVIIKTGVSTKGVRFKSKTHSISKLICEAWHGLRENSEHCAIRIDGNFNNNHYTNLKWGMKGRNSTSKILPHQKEEIKQRFENGETAIDLAKEFGIKRQSIYKIIKS